MLITTFWAIKFVGFQDFAHVLRRHKHKDATTVAREVRSRGHDSAAESAAHPAKPVS